MHRLLLVLLLLLTATVAPRTADVADAILARMDARAAHYGDLSRRIWELSELGYQERESAALLKAELKAAGFTVTEGAAGIPTAFTATWGSGRPVIGLMAEYDALPGLSQDAVPERRPRVEGGSGHGCGHNLFGVASVFAAVAAKEHLEETGGAGTIRVFGTPAEEGGSGKVYLARAGEFDDVDVMLHWHPSDRNAATLNSTLAVVSAKVRFAGRAAHAASAPDKGRSALDAVMLFAHGVDLLREHIPTASRLHYVITGGGAAPNIVPDATEVYVYARHPEMTTLDGIWQRVLKCAEAGALATETTMTWELVASAWDVLPNDALSALIDRQMRRVGGVVYDDEERAFAEALQRTLPPGAARPLGSEARIDPPDTPFTLGSTDAGDVSWLVPTGWFVAATYVPGTPGHTWQATACTGVSVGRKGMMVAAKTLALTTVALLTDPAEVAAARRSFDERRAGRRYESRIPPGAGPPLDYRK